MAACLLVLPIQVTAQRLQLAQHDLIAIALQLSAALHPVAAKGLDIVLKDHVAGLLLPHDRIVLTDGWLYGPQVCPGGNAVQKMRMFLCRLRPC
jgi:hypothetical protein